MSKVKSPKRRTTGTDPSPRAGAAALEALAPLLAALPREQLVAPRIPVANLVQEAHALALIAEAKADALAAVGLAAVHVERLAQAADALSEAQARLAQVRASKRTETEIVLEDAGTQLRADLIAAGRFALRTNEDAQAVLDDVQDGTGADDLLQDLKTLAVFVEEHRPDFERVGRRAREDADRARRVAKELESHLAARRSAGIDETGALALRNRCTTLLQESMSEVRAAGGYAFRHDPKTRAKFRSAYDARARRRPKRSGMSEPSGEGSGALV